MSPTRQIVKRTAVILAGLIVSFIIFYAFWLFPRYTAPILAYHHFGYVKQSLYVTPENFDKQMHYMKNKGYNVISLGELVEGIKQQKKFAQKTVVITIDDGYKDNFTYAYPVLKKYGFPATIFVVSDYIGVKEDFMNWDQASQMLNSGISFGGHTRNHAYLPSVKDRDVLWEEIAGCKDIIEKHIKAPVDYFCYPIGGFAEETKIFIRKAGYKGACTTNRGFDRFNRSDVYELNRVKVTNSDMNAPFSFWAKVSGYYNLFRARKKGD